MADLNQSRAAAADHVAPLLAAPVAGFPAFVLAKILEHEMPRRLVALQQQAETGRVHPARLAEVTATWAAIRQAGEQWQQWKRRDAAADGSTAEDLTTTPAGSGEIDSSRAAGLLGVTPNRVRQLIRNGEIPGRKVARVWLVDRAAVELRRGYNSGHFR